MNQSSRSEVPQEQTEADDEEKTPRQKNEAATGSSRCRNAKDARELFNAWNDPSRLKVNLMSWLVLRRGLKWNRRSKS